MAVTSLGTLPVSALAPSAVTAVAAVTATVGSVVPSLEAQLSGAAEALVQMGVTPPTLALSLASAVQTVASLTAAISAGVPDLSFQVTAITELIANLTAQIADLNAQLALTVDISAALAVGGLAAYLYTGDTSAMATELGPYTNGGVAGGGPTTDCTGLLLAAVDPATIAAMQLIFGI